MTSTPRPWRPLALLAGGVLLAHLALLQALPWAAWQPLRPAAQVQIALRAPPTAATSPPTAVFEQKEPLPVADKRADAMNSGASGGAAQRAASGGPAGAPGAAAAPNAPAAPALSAHALPASVPQGMRLRYAVEASRRGVARAGHATLDWRASADAYEARMDWWLDGAPAGSHASSGAVTAAGLQPRRFSERRRSEEAAHFDHAGARVVFSANRPEAPLAAGAQDRLSVLLQLGALVAAQPQAWTPGRRIAIQTVTTRDADPWLFTVEGEETLQLPGGVQQALRLVRLPDRPYALALELWLAPGLAYAPVRLRLTQANGDWLDQRWAGTDSN